MLAALAHNLLRAAGTLFDNAHAVARGRPCADGWSTFRPRIARPQGKPTLHLPAHWPPAQELDTLWDRTFTTRERQVAA